MYLQIWILHVTQSAELLAKLVELQKNQKIMVGRVNELMISMSTRIFA
jgi:hypothetical protein